MTSPAPTRLLAALLVLALPARPVLAAPPAGDERRSPTYLALATALERLRAGAPTAGLDAEGGALAPFLDALDRRHARGLRRRLDQAAESGDRAACLDTLVQAVVLDGQDRLGELRRDEYYGWHEGLQAVRRFALRYQLVSATLREAQPAADAAVRRQLEALLEALRKADLTTDPRVIEEAAGALRARLADVRAGVVPRATVKLVVNLANPITSLTREAAQRLFLRKTAAWPDGQPVEPVAQVEGSPAHGPFCLEIFDRSPKALRAAWNQLIFEGRGVPPPMLGSDAEVLAYVKAHRGAVGYVSPGAATDGVKVLRLGD